MENEKTFVLAERENLLVERLNYIFESSRAMVSILARELADAENATAKEMLLAEKESCKRAFLELRVAQDAVLDAKFAGHRPDNVQFKFDFPNREVTCRW